MKPDITPIGSLWFADADFSLDAENRLHLRPKLLTTILVASIPTFLGLFILFKSTAVAISEGRLIYFFGAFFGVLMAFIFLFLSYTIFSTLFFDYLIFDNKEKRVYVKRGRFSGLINRTLTFEDIAIFQIIEYIDRIDDENNQKSYELNMVLYSGMRINLIQGNKKNAIKNARKVSLFTNKKVKLVRYGYH